MPCYLVVQIVLKDMDTEIILKALEELNLVQNRHYSVRNGVVTLLDRDIEGVVKQRYGVIKSEREARRKGWATQRQSKENGEIVLTLSRN